MAERESIGEFFGRRKREKEAFARTENIRKDVQTTSATLADLLKSGPVGEMQGAPISTAVEGPLEKPQAVDRAQLEKGQAFENAIVDLALRGGDTKTLAQVGGLAAPKTSAAKTSAPTDIDDFVVDAEAEAVRLGGKLTPGQRNKARLKFKRAQAVEKKANRFATKNVDKATAEKIAFNKEKGKALAVIETTGDIIKAKGQQTPIQKIGIAKKRMAGNLATLSNHFLNLDSMGAITNVDNNAMENIFAATKASSVGQTFGRITGSDAQSIRKSINNLKPLLIQDIRQSTDMGARGLDSEKELEFYLQAVSNEKSDLQSNIAAIVVLDEAFGDGTVAKQLRSLTDESIIKRISNEGDKILKGGAPGGQELPGTEGGPQVGVIEDGFRFKGGDPSIPDNWEQVR